MSTDNNVRVRFAPSPTGPLHMGGVRTALYNYLFAKKHGGTFVLRIEDTDRTRFVDGAEAYITESLAWCGLSPDESVEKGGDFGPYRQSERRDLYDQYIKELLEKGRAYLAFDTPEEIDSLRKKAESEGKVWQYDATTRSSMRNSLTLSKDEVDELLQSNTPFTYRFLMPEDRVVVINDLVRGKIEINTKVLDDKVLMKGDGMPTYHFANIVDDHCMEISHVIRGEEWLPSAPLHTLLYEAFDWTPPAFAHLPLILKPNGPGKLSKRDGDEGGFPIFPLEWNDPNSNAVSSGYRESGYINQAFVNMLLMLGWNPGTEQEMFSMDEMIEAFSIERVVKSGARFNVDKAKWFNGEYMKTLSPAEIAEKCRPILENANVDFGDRLEEACGIMAERLTFPQDILNSTYLFQEPTAYDEKTVRKKWKEQSPGIANELAEKLGAIDDYTAENVEVTFKQFLEEKELGFGAALPVFRLLLTGQGGGPSMFEISAFLGKDETLNRIEKGINKLS